MTQGSYRTSTGGAGREVPADTSARSADSDVLVSAIVQTTGDLPSLPAIANQVMQKVSDPNTTSKDLQDIISLDQALAARVLKIANSAFFGCSRRINRLTDAINIMGFNSIKSLVMTSVLGDLFKSFGLTEKLLWEHSIGCATACRKISRALRFPGIEEAFLAGLMHDIGKVVLNLRQPERMFEIFQEVYNQPGQHTFHTLEMREFGFDHAQVGRLMARKWNFAEEIEEAIGCHHDLGRAHIMPILAHIVSLGNGICHRLEIGPTRDPDLDPAELESAVRLRLDRDAIGELVESVAETWKEQGVFDPR